MQRSTHSLLLVLFIIVGLVSACAVPTPTPSSAPTTRTITHALGASEIPVNPQRVVVLDTGELDNALALGASIIGAPVAEALEYQAYLADQLDGITDTGAISEPSLETILTLKPDLILGSKQRHEAIYAQLSAIAPTVFTESLRVPWQDNFNLHAEALGKSTEAEALLTAYAARTAAIKAALGDNPPTISIIRFRPGQVRLYLKSSYIGYILQDVGLPRPPAQDQDSFSSEISLEQVADIDADYIFITGYAQDDSDQDKFLKSELWTTLGAVQNEQAIDVDDDTWIAGLGVQSANLVLADLSKLLGLTIDQTTAAAPATADAFPVTIEHKYGSTTITKKPERIVTVGLTDHDALLALGIVPVGTTEWFGGYPGSIWPWAQDEWAALGGAVPEAVGGESINFEKIAALQPDLILALYAGVTQEQYDLLTQIAPTVAQPADYVDYGIPWQELTLTVGKAVGQAEAAQALVDEVEAQFVQVQADHPEFVGATAVATMAWQGIYLYGPQDIRSRLLTALGFVLPEGIEAITGSGFGGNLSMERADLLDTDVIIWIDPQEAEGELGGPVYQALPVHTEGREVLLSSYDELAVGGATSFISVLSLPYLLDNLVPMLVAALDGDPATAVSAPAVDSPTATFPVTIEHKMGSTTIPAKPERVVSLGFTDQDYLLALGVVPVGIRDWFGEQPNAVWPWARHLLNGAEPEVLPRELNFEQIARLQPDLIVAIYTSLTQEEYDLLSEIAPVVTAPAGLDDYAITWQEQTRYTGQLVGQTARAEELVTALEAKLAQERADHPEFEGTEYAFASVYGGEYYLYGEQSTASRFLTTLGFAVPADVLELTENENDYLVFSAERMDLVDRPLTLWSEGPTDEGVIALLEDPLYTKLAVHTAGRDLFLGLDLYGGAFSFSSILSLDLLVDDLVPALALALDGDPATVPVLAAAAAAD